MKRHEKTEYDLQAETFCTKYGIKIECIYQGHYPYFQDETKKRAVYLISISRQSSRHDRIKTSRPISFTFGQSINRSYAKQFSTDRIATVPVKREPSNYDILACMASDSHDPGTFETDFCPNFGYDPDSRKGLETYLKVQEQYRKIVDFFSEEEIEALQEIQ